LLQTIMQRSSLLYLFRFQLYTYIITILFLSIFPISSLACTQHHIHPSAPLDPEYFGIYEASANGQNAKILFSDPCREMTHARMSPNGDWVTFTRYNKKDPKTGLATEDGDYTNTEIMIARSDGSGLRSLVPAQESAIAANGYWTPDGQSILFIGSDSGKGLPGIRSVDVATGQVRSLNLRPGYINTDPHQIGNYIVFASRRMPYSLNSIWLYDLQTGKIKKASNPPHPSENSGIKYNDVKGDFDPKLSPDGKYIAFMRRFEQNVWRVVLIDIEQESERILTDTRTTNAIPEWSSDGKTLIFWHVDLRNLKRSGIYTMSSDGTNRKRIGLPKGYFYKTVSYFPSAGQGHIEQKILVSAKKEPALL
jgi:Tol biopolymer transport system component